MLEVKSTGEDNWKEMEGGESEREAASEARRLREIGGRRGMRARVFQATIEWEAWKKMRGNQGERPKKESD